MFKNIFENEPQSLEDLEVIAKANEKLPPGFGAFLRIFARSDAQIKIFGERGVLSSRNGNPPVRWKNNRVGQ